MRSTTTLLATTLLLSLGVAACGAGGDSTTGPGDPPDQPGTPTSVVGTFTLATHNGNPLPALAWHEEAVEGMPADMYVLSGSIELRPDSSYRQTATSRLVIEGVTDQTHTRATEGTYSFAPYQGDAVSGTLTFHAEGRSQSCPITMYSITCETSMPGPIGQPDIPVTLVWVRE